MSLKTEIAKLKGQNKSSIEFSFDSNHYELFRSPIFSDEKTILDYRYYLMNTADLKGEGNTSKVYVSYPIDENYQVDFAKPIATKIFHDKTKFQPEEVAILTRYYRTENIIEEDKRVILLTEYHQGNELISDEDEPHPGLQKLNLLQRINLIFQIILNLNLLHHNTARTGKPIIHCDLKGSNIIVDINDDTIEAAICDFGYSLELETDDPSELLHIKKLQCSPGYIPPEIFAYKRGLKSDVYSLLPLILTILGATAPFSKKQTFNNECTNIQCGFDNNYVFDGVLSGYAIPNYIEKIKPVIIDFLNRMHANYQFRPDSDELLHFFTSFNNYYLSCENQSNPQAQNILLSKMLLLSSGSWYQSLGQTVTNCFKQKDEKWYIEKQESIEKTYDQYNFNEHPIISETVVSLYHQQLFNSDFVNLLYQKNDPDFAKLILTLSKDNLLDDTLFSDILRNSANSKINPLKIVCTHIAKKITNQNVLDEKNQAIKKLHSLNLLNEDSLKLIIKSDEIAKNINQLSKQDCSVLKSLTHIGKKYGSPINLNTLEKIITSDGVSSSEAVKATLKQYQQNRRNDKRGNYFHFWSHLTGYDCMTKCNAVDEIIELIDNRRTEMTELSHQY